MTKLATEERYQPGCPFCDIASGSDEETIVIWRDPHWTALFPLEPATLGHTLVIPNCHVQDLWHAKAQVAESLMQACLDVGGAISQSMKPDGMNLITSAGTAAEQTVFHLHLHLVPRWNDDGFGEIWPSHEEWQPEADLASAAAKIRTKLKANLGSKG